MPAKTKTKSPKVKTHPTFIPLTAATVDNDDGANDHSEEILEVLNEVILKNYKTFNLRDLTSLLASKDIPYPEIAAVFSKWTAKLEREKKIQASPLFDLMYINNEC